MSTTARITTRSGQATVRVEVDYDGIHPPRALFADLTMIGWQPPAFAPPPREAIDWTVPNPETGERFTVRAYRVDRAVVEPPRGSGPRGTWIEGERAPFLSTVQRVLARHGLFDEAQPGTPDPRPAPPDAVAITPITPNQPEAPANQAVRLLLDPAQRDQVEMLLLGAGVNPRIGLEDQQRIESFRGSRRTLTTTKLVVEFVASAQVASRLVVAIEQLAARAAAPQSTNAIATGTATALRAGQARISMIFAIRHRQTVTDLAAGLKLTTIRWSDTTMTGTQSFRGSSHEVQKPALRIEVDVPARQEPGVRTALATAVGVTPSPSGLLSVTFAERTPEPESTPEPASSTEPEAILDLTPERGQPNETTARPNPDPEAANGRLRRRRATISQG